MNPNTDSNIKYLQDQLVVARKEIANLRQQIKSLGHVHQTECNALLQTLQQYKCPECLRATPQETATEATETPEITVKPIGHISTEFPEKRGTPRQPGITQSLAKLTINDVFTNPEHSLEGLDQFSHLWILFYFHKNDSNHVRAKVSPPRLNGLRTGVFASRSPHRPSPIGLSLVKIDRIEGNCIYFLGVDMIDKTPVLDIKPYIPAYDSPLTAQTSDGDPRVEEREAPDGEEASSETAVPTIRVPNWVQQGQTLQVEFNERALQSLQLLKKDEWESTKGVIANVLKEDPRSVFLRTRWSNQFYTFRISELNVSCKFNDNDHVVTVFQIQDLENLQN